MMIETIAEVERWGAAYTDEPDPRPLLRLANEVKRRISPTLPVRLAAAEVLALVKRAPPSGRWFIFQRGGRASAASEIDGWVEPASTASLAWAEAEGIELSPESRAWRVVGGGGPWAEAFGVPGLSGAAGSIACLEDCWVNRANDSADLDSGPAGAVAILRSDADRLFALEDAKSAPLQLVAAIVWDGKRLADRRVELVAARDRAPMQMLMKESGLSERAIQRSIKAHKAATRVAAPFNAIAGALSGKKTAARA